MSRRGPAEGLGLILPTFPQQEDLARTASLLADRCRTAEALGITSLWASDHLYWPRPSLECLTAATVAATSTERATVGAGVLQLPLRDPAPVAKALASLQVLSGGRAVLGLGVGRHRLEYEAAGRDFVGRGDALDAGITQLHADWKGGVDGYHQLPPARVPLWFGGNRPVARRRVVTHGEGWMPLFVTPEMLASSVRELRSDLVATGRRADAVTIAPVVPVLVGAVAEGASWLGSHLGVEPERASPHIVSGCPDEVVAGLDRFTQAGADHVILLVTADDPLPTVEAVLAARSGRRSSS